MEQSRDSDGKFAANGHSGEQDARENKRYSVSLHTQRSVGTQTGKSALVGLAKNLGRAALGVAAGFAGTIGKNALRSQGRGGRR
jgi:hypothetical protein